MPCCIMFWKNVTDCLQNTPPIGGKYNLMNFTALSLRLETHSSGYSLQLSYRLLLARFHIWQAKMDETSPNFEKSRGPPKMEFSCR